jgi:hypothetical protein
MSIYDDERRRFLTLVPDDLGGWLTNIVLGEVRQGAHLPSDVREGAIRTLRARLGAWGKEDERVRTMLGLLLRHRHAAERFAAWCIDYEELPPEEKQREKAARGEEHRRAWLDGQPPTEKQLRFLRSLGYRGPVTSKAHASSLIDGLLKTRTA